MFAQFRQGGPGVFQGLAALAQGTDKNLRALRAVPALEQGKARFLARGSQQAVRKVFPPKLPGQFFGPASTNGDLQKGPVEPQGALQPVAVLPALACRRFGYRRQHVAGTLYPFHLGEEKPQLE